MVWGCFAASGPGRLAVINGTMNSAVYQKILKDNVRQCLFVTSSWSELGFCSRTMIQNTPANPPLNGWRKTKWRLWSGLVKVLTWILLRCCGMTLKRRFMLENPPMWLNYKNSARMSGPKFLHSAVTDSLQVIANAWLQLLLLRVAQPVIRFRGQALSHTGPCGFGFCFPFIIKKLHSKTACCVYLCYLWLFKFVWWSETLKCDKHAKKLTFSHHCIWTIMLKSWVIFRGQ